MPETVGPYRKFMGRWGWPLMGFFAAAPVLAHALDWRSRAEAKMIAREEKMRRMRQQLAELHGMPLTAEDVYKAAAFIRTLEGIPNCPIEQLNLLDKALRSRK